MNTQNEPKATDPDIIRKCALMSFLLSPFLTVPHWFKKNGTGEEQ
jgi:hypothetical protein